MSVSKQPAPTNPLDEVLTLAEAARLSGLSPHTLVQQAERGKLRARKAGRTWITTREGLNEYLALHSRRRNKRDGLNGRRQSAQVGALAAARGGSAPTGNARLR
ncbi:MAG: helix-turn-helix domain-containing protein [Chloroflexi bacterium]|nr:helix-turn-helix domain-containing protein [Chloroflexota bacterium]